MKTVHCTTAQALVRFLDQQYVSLDGKESKFVEGVSVIFGHGIVLGLGEALLHEDHGLKVFQGRNEQGMAHTALGFAKQHQRRKIIAVASSVGPGAANMVTAAATATANHLPLLLLPGDTFATRQPDPVLQQIEQPYDLSLTTNDAFRLVSRYFDRILRPEMLMSAMINAMRVLSDPQGTGAVTIALPQDVQGEAWDFPESFFKKRIHTLIRTLPDSEMLHKAAYQILDSRHPLLIVGGGCRYSEAGARIREFCNEFKLPMAETQAGKSTVTSDFFYNLGGIGVTGNLAANRYVRDCDLILGLGTRLTDFTTGSKELFSQAKLIQINLSDFHGLKMDALPIKADVKVALEQLAQILRQHHYHHENDIGISKVKRQWNEEVARFTRVRHSEQVQPEIKNDYAKQLQEYQRMTASCLSQTAAIKLINEKIAPSSLIVAASGSLPGDLQRMWISRSENSYNVEYGYSCMGFEIAAALGAKLAQPQREVYAMVGDAAFLMLHGELVTSLQENAKITVCLFDNMSNGCISNLQMSNGLESFCTDFRYRGLQSGKLDGSYIPIDYAAVARGYGCEAWTVRSEKELEEALVKAARAKHSVLIDIKVLPKTMSDGYDAWWNVGLASVSPFEKVEEAYQQLQSQREKARRY